mmetsp:Transcript_4601/g.10094  ORF Transcript_4601/g.10094 Transcript_4601/m.10094 type:complete len:225 (+) Transcript_4601:397-1071(+)
MLTESLATIGESPSRKQMLRRVRGCPRVASGAVFGRRMTIPCRLTIRQRDVEEIGVASTALPTADEMKRLRPVEASATVMCEHPGQHVQTVFTGRLTRRILVHVRGLLACAARMRSQPWTTPRFTSPVWWIPNGSRHQILPLVRTAVSICMLRSMKWMWRWVKMIRDPRQRESVWVCHHRMIGRWGESSFRRVLCLSLDHLPVAASLNLVVGSLQLRSNQRPHP